MLVFLANRRVARKRRSSASPTPTAPPPQQTPPDTPVAESSPRASPSAPPLPAKPTLYSGGGLNSNLRTTGAAAEGTTEDQNSGGKPKAEREEEQEDEASLSLEQFLESSPSSPAGRQSSAAAPPATQKPSTGGASPSARTVPPVTSPPPQGISPHSHHHQLPLARPLPPVAGSGGSGGGGLQLPTASPLAIPLSGVSWIPSRSRQVRAWFRPMFEELWEAAGGEIVFQGDLLEFRTVYQQAFTELLSGTDPLREQITPLDWAPSVRVATIDSVFQLRRFERGLLDMRRRRASRRRRPGKFGSGGDAGAGGGGVRDGVSQDGNRAAERRNSRKQWSSLPAGSWQGLNGEWNDPSSNPQTADGALLLRRRGGRGPGKQNLNQMMARRMLTGTKDGLGLTGMPGGGGGPVAGAGFGRPLSPSPETPSGSPRKRKEENGENFDSTAIPPVDGAVSESNQDEHKETSTSSHPALRPPSE